MRSIRYSSHPRECDELLDILARDYEFSTDNYAVAWRFRQFLKTLQLCDFSEILDDMWYEKDRDGGPLLISRRIIFFTCRKRDMERMCYILERLGGNFVIIDSDTGAIEYGGVLDVW